MCCRYVRVLGAFYLRLTGSDTDVYRYLEPLYNDYRKLRRKLADGRKISIYICSSLPCQFYLKFPSRALNFVSCFMFIVLITQYSVAEFALTHVDEVIDELLTRDYSCDIALPRIKKRCLYLLFNCIFWILNL